MAGGVGMLGGGAALMVRDTPEDPTCDLYCTDMGPVVGGFFVALLGGALTVGGTVTLAKGLSGRRTDRRTTASTLRLGIGPGSLRLVGHF